MRKSSFRATLLVTTVLGVAAAMPAYAAGDQVEEIVVTARRVEERLQDVPIAITVLNQSQLKNANVSTAADLAKVVPSLGMVDTWGNDASTFVVRGFYSDTGTAPTVGVFFADVVAPRAGMEDAEGHGGNGAGPGDFFDLQNVQVLKGPQGTLFGRNTTGGDILLVPQKPTAEFGGYLEAGVGNDGFEHAEGVINIPVSDKLRIRAGVDQEIRDGYLDNVSGIGPSKLGNENYVSVRFSVDADITADLENYTVARFGSSDTRGIAEKLLDCNPASQPVGTEFCAQLARDNAAGTDAVESNLPSPDDQTRQWQIINTTTWAATDNLTLKNIASYSQFWARRTFDIFGFNTTVPSFGGLLKTDAGQPWQAVDLYPYPANSSDQENITEELQLHGTSFDDRLDWQVGAYTEQSFPLGLAGTASSTFVVCNGDPRAEQCADPIDLAFHQLAGSNDLTFGTIIYRDYAGYGQGTFTITDNLKFTAGLRWTDDIISASFDRENVQFPAPNAPLVICQTTLAPKGPGNDCHVSVRTSSNKPTWTMDLDYTPIEDVLTYATYSRGYRQGGINPAGPVDPVIGDKFFTYQPESIDAYEIGVKSTFQLPFPAVYNVAAFWNELSNQQTTATFFGNGGQVQDDGIVNVGKARVRGFEADVTAHLFTGFSANVSYTYLDTIVESLTPPSLAGSPLFSGKPGDGSALEVLQGQRLPFSPRNKAAVTLAYQLPVDESLGTITVLGTYLYTDNTLYYPGAAPLSGTPAYSLVNFNVNWQGINGGPFDAEFFMTNALDQRYYGVLSHLYDALGTDSATVGEPRMFGARLRYHF